MDVYGYDPWQYNRSNELSQQIYSQQVLAENVGYNRPSEAHIMPVPSGTPWNIQGISWGMPSPQPQLVQFTGQDTSPPVQKPLHCKRKPIDVEPPIPAKVLITEEKMAAHLNSLHISSDYTPHILASEELMDVLPNVESRTLTSEKLKGHTIVLSEEIKKIKDEPLLPPSLIERLEKPCMSLIVWKPKESVLKKQNEDSEDNKNDSEVSPRRNGVLVIDDTAMDVEMR